MSLPTVVFITAIKTEFEAVVAHLPSAKPDTIEGIHYQIGEYVTPDEVRWRVVVRQLKAMGNYESQYDTRDAITNFSPTAMFFVGVAGGIKDVKLGDVVIAKEVLGYEAAKVEQGFVKHRLHMERSDKNLIEIASRVDSQTDWLAKIKDKKNDPDVYIGSIASGEKVIASAEFLSNLQQTCSSAVAVEMEAIGFLRAVRDVKQISGVVVRGISDLVVDKSARDGEGWQPIAARNAAAFAFAMLDKLPLPTQLSEQSTESQTIFAVPHIRTEYFTGRETILQKTHELLAEKTIVALHGLGGVGKTQTMLEYAHLHQADYPVILWASAESEMSFQQNFLKLAQVLGVPMPEQTTEMAIYQVKRWLTENRNWLLLLDNVEDLMVIRAFVGEFKAFGRLLLTTRNASTRPIAEPVEVVKLSEAEGVAFLTKRTGYEADEFARELVQLLDGLPLALDQAAAYIAGGKTFQRYLELYQTHGLKLLEKRGLLAHEDDHPDPVAVTWLLSFEKVQENPLAEQILQQCAFLYGDGIIQAVFAELDPLEYDEAIDEILKYSLLKRDDKAGFLLMHRLVQAVLRAQLTAQKAVVEQLVPLVLGAYPGDELEQSDYQAWAERGQDWLENAQVLESWRAQEQIKSEATGTLLNQMGYYFVVTGNYTQALPLFQQALQITEQVLGKQHPDYATSLNNLAELYRAQGEYEKALPLYQQALEIDKQVLGEQHPDYATDLNNLAELYREQGEYEKALPLFQQALQIVKQVLGKQHPDYAQSLNNLAGLYHTQGEYEKALPLYQQALQIREQVLGKLHPDYAQSLNNLAGLYHTQGDYEKALPLYQQALQIFEQVLGEQHPNTKIVAENYERCLNAMKENGH